jgi:hypothetical protein
MLYALLMTPTCATYSIHFIIHEAAHYTTSSSPRYLLPLRSKYSPHTVLKALSLCSSRNVRD